MWNLLWAAVLPLALFPLEACHPDLTAMWYIFVHPRVMSCYWTKFSICLELLSLAFVITSCELNSACSSPLVLWQTTTVLVAEMTWDSLVLSLVFSCAPIWGQNKVWRKWPFLPLQCYSRMRPILAQTHGHHAWPHMEGTMTHPLEFLNAPSKSPFSSQNQD